MPTSNAIQNGMWMAWWIGVNSMWSEATNAYVYAPIAKNAA